MEEIMSTMKAIEENQYTNTKEQNKMRKDIESLAEKGGVQPAVSELFSSRPTLTH